MSKKYVLVQDNRDKMYCIYNMDSCSRTRWEDYLIDIEEEVINTYKSFDDFKKDYYNEIIIIYEFDAFNSLEELKNELPEHFV